MLFSSFNFDRHKTNIPNFVGLLLFEGTFTYHFFYVKKSKSRAIKLIYVLRTILA
jgi:hypothetical protein